MIRFLDPAFLLPGVAVALIVTALHFIVRSPVRRAPLPTLRFLSPAPRTAVRLRRRPHDVGLLLLRVLFALLLAAAFARPVWTERRAQHARILLIDRGAGMHDAWNATIDSARARLRAAAAIVIVFDTAALVVAPERADSAWLDTLRDTGTADVEADYRSAFHALARHAGAVPADLYDAVLITVPRWSAYRAGTASVRRAAWPGLLTVVATGDVMRGSEPSQPRVIAGAGTALRDAVESLGWTAIDDSATGATRITGPGVALHLDASDWRYVTDSVAAHADMVFRGGWTVSTLRSGSFVRASGRAPAPDATPPGHAIAAWSDGAIAAITTGSVITTAFDPDDDAITTSPEYPELIRHLVLGRIASAGGNPSDAMLDTGALQQLQGTGGERVRAADLPVPIAGRPLGTVLLLLALVCAVAEWPLRRKADTRHRDS